ncbi:MAG: cytochrome C oxidase subunit III [Armatimonadota bacterium]
MAAIAGTGGLPHSHRDAAHDHGILHHQFEDVDQQNESYVVGMWTFLVTEIMFFAALFLAYSLYRMNYQKDWYLAHEHLSVFWGGLNTFNLLISSFLMALAVHFAQLKQRKVVIGHLLAVISCGGLFMAIKFIEYREKFADGLFPGQIGAYNGFTSNPEVLHGANLNHAQLFYGLYFGMTGLHGVHVIVGMVIISVLAFLWFKRWKPVTEDYIPTELVGLYWHFVDIVWIFLFPLFYLMPMPNGMGGH